MVNKCFNPKCKKPLKSKDAIKFCSRGCSISFNNSINPKRKAPPKRKCAWCLSIISHHKKYCDRECNVKHVLYTNLENKRKSFKQGKLNQAYWIKIFLIEKFGRKCAICGRKTWRGQPITLWVDHKDGNATNNKPINLRLLCLNCDSQQPTFGAKNIGNGRKSQGMGVWRLV